MEKTKLDIVQGRSKRVRFRAERDGVARDLTGYTVQMQVRSDPTSETVVFDSDSAQYATLQVLAPATDGWVELYLGARATAALPVDESGYGSYVWDVVVENPNDPDDVFTLDEGSMTVRAGVTR